MVDEFPVRRQDDRSAWRLKRRNWGFVKSIEEQRCMNGGDAALLGNGADDALDAIGEGLSLVSYRYGDEDAVASAFFDELLDSFVRVAV